MMNEMRDRLVELLEQKMHPYLADDIADFLLDDGWIRPPCKVGDTVYYIAGNKVYKSKCHAITLQPTMQIHLYDYDGDNARYSTKSVFLTKEQAEQKLKELRGE